MSASSSSSRHDRDGREERERRRENWDTERDRDTARSRKRWDPNEEEIAGKKRERREHRPSPPSRRERSHSRSPPRRRSPERNHEKGIKREPMSPTSDRRGGGRNRNDNRESNRSRESTGQEREDGKKWGLEKRANQDRKEEGKWGRPEMWEKPKTEEDENPIVKEKVNMETSGTLAEDTNMFKGVLIKYNEPPEAKKPKLRWRLYPFKDDDTTLPVLYIHRQSAYLIGRDRKVADLPIDHPSCSKQHAVLQYRSMPFVKADGTRARRILPYIIDLGSANGTYLNGTRIESQRYFELQEKDVLKFGFSSREYVVLNERSTGQDEEDNGEGAGSGDEDEDVKNVKMEVDKD